MHKDDIASICPLNKARLCFQVLLEGQAINNFTIPLEPIVSNVIIDKIRLTGTTYGMADVTNLRNELVEDTQDFADTDLVISIQNGSFDWDKFDRLEQKLEDFLVNQPEGPEKINYTLLDPLICKNLHQFVNRNIDRKEDFFIVHLKSAFYEGQGGGKYN